MSGMVNIYAVKDFSKLEMLEGDQILEVLMGTASTPKRAPPPLETPPAPKKRRLNTQEPLRVASWWKLN